MKFDGNELAQAVSFAAQGCGSRDPVYSGLCMECSPGGVTFTGSDGSVSFVSGLEYDEDAGRRQVILPGIFPEIARNLPGGDVLLEISKGVAVISCGRSKFTLPLIAADYPVRVPDVPVTGALDGQEFSRALKRVLPAVARDHPVPVLTGILVRQVDGELDLLATDRYCMATATCEFSPVDTGTAEIVLPGTIASRLVKLDGNITIGWNNGLIQVCTPDGDITCRSLQGRFPAAKEPGDEDFIFLPEGFAASVKRAALTGILAVTVTIGDELLVESSSGQGEFAESFPLGYDGHARFTASPKMLLDGLAGCDEPEMSVPEPGKPVHILDKGFRWTLQPRKET